MAVCQAFFQDKTKNFHLKAPAILSQSIPENDISPTSQGAPHPAATAFLSKEGVALCAPEGVVLPQSLRYIIHSVLRIEKKFSAGALSYGFLRLDMDGVM